MVIVVVTTVVVASLQPNQPGVKHVVVVYVEVLVVMAVVVVVDWSRQPHQPGVWHVAVRVREVVLEVEELLLVVSLPLLSKNFQLKQSTHSLSSWHDGTVSYLASTSLITLLILCVPTPTRQPRSPTVSYVHVMPV